MSYTVSIRNPKHFGDIYEISDEPLFVSWFNKSWTDLSLRYVNYAEYEKEFNVKLIMSPGLEYIPVAIEFPTEEDAVMFMLRWS